jgi:hypothetical protein
VRLVFISQTLDNLNVKIALKVNTAQVLMVTPKSLALRVSIAKRKPSTVISFLAHPELMVPALASLTKDNVLIVTMDTIASTQVSNVCQLGFWQVTTPTVLRLKLAQIPSSAQRPCTAPKVLRLLSLVLTVTGPHTEAPSLRTNASLVKEVTSVTLKPWPLTPDSLLGDKIMDSLPLTTFKISLLASST